MVKCLSLNSRRRKGAHRILLLTDVLLLAAVCDRVGHTRGWELHGAFKCTSNSEINTRMAIKLFKKGKFFSFSFSFFFLYQC